MERTQQVTNKLYPDEMESRGFQALRAGPGWAAQGRAGEASLLPRVVCSCNRGCHGHP